MVTFMFHIKARVGCEVRALEALAAIEKQSQDDDGRINFIWLQHADRPYEFVLFEQWRDAAALDAHRSKSPALWESFVPCLDGEPHSEELRQVIDMTRPMTEEEVRSFVDLWFDRLSNRADVNELLEMLSDGDLEMIFPERNLRSKAEFSDWYEGVGHEYAHQSHVVEELTTTKGDDGVLLNLIVIWRAERQSDGSELEVRATQEWELATSFTTAKPVISRYRVLTLEDVAGDR